MAKPIESTDTIHALEHAEIAGVPVKKVVVIDSSGNQIIDFGGSTSLALRVDDVSPITYVGEAATGSATSSAVWRIKKIDETSSPDVIVTWADGNGNFDNIWDNRLSLSYS